MKPKVKTILLLLVFAAPAVVMCVLIVKQPRIVPPPVLIQTPPQHHPRKEKMLATLKTESLDDSIRLLMNEREQYVYTFAFLSKDGEDVQQDLEQMLSTR